MQGTKREKERARLKGGRSTGFVQWFIVSAAGLRPGVSSVGNITQSNNGRTRLIEKIKESR